MLLKLNVIYSKIFEKKLFMFRNRKNKIKFYNLLCKTYYDITKREEI
jgi:hypothetical protein